MATAYKYRMVTNESASKKLGKIEWIVKARSANDVLTLVWREIEKDNRLKEITPQNWRDYFKIQIKRGNNWEKVQKKISFNTEPVGTIIGNQMTQEDIQKSIAAAQEKAEKAADTGTTIQQPKPATKKEEPAAKKEEPKPIHDMWHDDSGNLLEWKDRWALAENNKRELENNNTLKYTNERQPKKDELDQRYQDKQKAWDKVNRGDFFAIGEAILKEIEFGVQYIGTYISYIPRDINDGLKMMSADLTLLSLSIERVINILGGIWEIIVKLNSMGALDLIEKYIKSVNRTIENGIKEGILDKDGNLKKGFTNFAVAGVHGPNSADEIRTMLTMQEIAEDPIFGREIRKLLKTEMLMDYEKRTGVGFPDENAMIRWILGNSGAFMPIQQASEIAGNIPEWWLIGKAQKITKEIRESERRELEKQRKDFRERQVKQQERIKNIHPWVKR